MYKKHNSFSVIALLFMPRLSEHELSGTLGMLTSGCVFLTSTDIIIAIRQLYGASKIVTRLLVQLKVDAGMANQEWRPTLRRQLTSIISTIFTSTISVPAGCRKCTTSSRAPRVIFSDFLIKKCFITITLNHFQLQL